MKTIADIHAKIEEHENKINELLADKPEVWTDIHVMSIENLLIGRKALLWVLSDRELLESTDDFEKNARYECMVFEAGKIF